MGTEGRAVLRTWDQHQGRSPTACVCTGDPTDRATTSWAVELPHQAGWTWLLGANAVALLARLVRRPRERVVLAVSPRAWRRWRISLSIALAVTTAGVVVTAIALVRGDAAGVIVGVALFAGGAALRTRATRRSWVRLELHHARGEVVVSPVHPAFAQQAQRIYVDSIRRHPAPR